MTIGRLEFGIMRGQRGWGIERCYGGCIFLELGRFYIGWIGKECKCQKCEKHVCECE
jgi:hypothetical protein